MLLKHSHNSKEQFFIELNKTIIKEFETILAYNMTILFVGVSVLSYLSVSKVHPDLKRKTRILLRLTIVPYVNYIKSKIFYRFAQIQRHSITAFIFKVKVKQFMS